MSHSGTDNDVLITVGWREWVALPELGIDRIKAKVDTGARTSSLHAFEVRDFEENGVHRVEFKIHPRQRNTRKELVCVADIVDQRSVSDSGGHRENRWVIRTPLTIGAYRWDIELNLTARDDMRFRMLLGRTALRGRAMVDSASSYRVGKRRKNKQPKQVGKQREAASG